MRSEVDACQPHKSFLFLFFLIKNGRPNNKGFLKKKKNLSNLSIKQPFKNIFVPSTFTLSNRFSSFSLNKVRHSSSSCDICYLYIPWCPVGCGFTGRYLLLFFVCFSLFSAPFRHLALTLSTNFFQVIAFVTRFLSFKEARVSLKWENTMANWL